MRRRNFFGMALERLVCFTVIGAFGGGGIGLICGGVLGTLQGLLLAVTVGPSYIVGSGGGYFYLIGLSGVAGLVLGAGFGAPAGAITFPILQVGL